MSEIEQIKERVDLVELSKQYMTLRNAGRNFQALCPFHQEKTPSLMISPDKQIWHCFGCGEGGDIFTLVQKIEGVDFYESLKILAEKAGVELKKSPGFQKFKNETDKYYEINKLAAEFYHQALKRSKSGEIARNYVQKRGLKNDIVDKFKIGYAPDMWDALVVFLQKRGYGNADIIGSGLGFTSRKGNLVDKFRQRLLFPIWDNRNRVVAFTGRVLEEKDNPKYLNTATTKIFDKGKVLYALNLAQDKIREKKQVIMCEGQMDVIACFQNGFEQAVCSSGTAVTKQQLILLKRLTDNILIAFDNDPAGQKAAYRLTQMALEVGLVVRVIDLMNYKDPDEMMKADVAKWQVAVSGAVSFVEYFLKVFDTEEKGVKDKSRLADQIMPLLYYVGDEVEKGHYLSNLADVLGVDEKFVLEKYNKYKPDKISVKEDNKYQSQSLSIEERLIGLMIVFYKYLKVKINNLQEKDFSGRVEEIVSFVKGFDQDALTLEDFAPILDEERKQWLIKVMVRIESDYAQLDEDLIVEEFQMLLNRYEEVMRVSLKEELEKKILQAEKSDDKEKIKQYIRSLQDLIIKGK